jgi:putative transposase
LSSVGPVGAFNTDAGFHAGRNDVPRRARLRIAGIPVHLIQRGNNRSPCFYANEDFLWYLQHLKRLAEKFKCAVHAYVLMTNHVHLLLTPEDANGPSLLMKNLGQRYVQYVNRTYRRSGTLWEGRFRSSLVQRQGYLLKCQRYIELNPVRAGMVRLPGTYPWSSYSANAELRSSALITPHAEYLALGETPEERAEVYRRLFRFELDNLDLQEIRSAANGGFALGNERFKAEIAATLGRRAERLRNRSSASAADH